MSLKSPWNIGRFLLLQLLAIGLTGLTMILGAAPLRVARKFYSAPLYWLSGATGALALYFTNFQEFSFGFFSLVLMMGILNEMETRNYSQRLSHIVSVSASSIFLYGSISVWSKVNGINWGERLETEIAKVSKVEMELPIDTILAQIPSIIVVMMIISLAFSLLWERRLRHLFGEESVDQVSERASKFAEFKVPEGLIWLLIPSLLFSVVYFEIAMLQNVSLNFLNVLLVLYLFQGLAVIHRLFWALKVGPFWRIFFYFFLIIQLHSILLISILGVADFWLNFREKIDRRLKSNQDGSSL